MKLGRNFVIYLVSSGVSGAMPLALMPFLTRSLAPVDYGVMVTITTLVALVGPLVNWATTAYLGVQYFKTPATELPGLLSSVLAIPLVSTAVLLLIFAMAQQPLQRWLGVPPGWNFVIPLMAAAALLPLVVQTVLAMRDRALGFATFEVGGALISFLATIVLVLELGFGWSGRVIATAIASTTLSAAALIWLGRQGLLGARPVRAEVGGALRFGAGGVAHDLANQALRLSDRLLIVALIGQAAVGTYAVAVQWTTIMLTVLTALNRAWVPFLFSSLASTDADAARRVVRRTYLVWAGWFAFFVLFNLVTPLGYRLLVDPRYHGSMRAVFWLSLGYFFSGVYVTVVDYIFYLKRTHLLAVITVFNLILNVTVAYFLIGRFGAVGSAMAFAIATAIVMSLTFLVSYRLHPMPWLKALAR